MLSNYFSGYESKDIYDNNTHKDKNEFFISLLYKRRNKSGIMKCKTFKKQQ